MAEKKNRVDTGALLAGMLGKTEETKTVKHEVPEPEEAPAAPETPTENIAPVQNSKVGRKAGEVKKQVSIYLPHELDRELSVQGALKEKEPDKSAIARTGIEIALSLSPQTYIELKQKAEATGKGIGDIVSEVLERGF